MRLMGRIESGLGKGSFFTTLDWVTSQFEKEMGFIPYPGTLNVRVACEDFAQARSLMSQTDFELIPDDPQFCAAGLKRVWVGGVPGAAVVPSEQVRVHGEDVIEIIARDNVKQSLGLGDGDVIMITDGEGGEPAGSGKQLVR